MEDNEVEITKMGFQKTNQEKEYHGIPETNSGQGLFKGFTNLGW